MTEFKYGDDIKIRTGRNWNDCIHFVYHKDTLNQFKNKTDIKIGKRMNLSMCLNVMDQKQNKIQSLKIYESYPNLDNDILYVPVSMPLTEKIE
jgi:hypothetical protein